MTFSDVIFWGPLPVLSGRGWYKAGQFDLQHIIYKSYTRPLLKTKQY